MALNSYKEERKNMSYTALYRKFRPDAFSDVKGQDHIVTTLKNQLRANRIGHAYLFTGTRGTGKTTVAKIFAKTVNCEHPTEDGPCGECRICKAIAAGASMNVIEIDAASNNGVDNIREIIDEVSYSPAEGKYKVYIIDEVHMLSPGAFNALLKTLEEPPSYVIFILATTEVHKIPITILSRCQRYDFKRISIDTITDRMKELMDTEQVQVEDRALRYIAKVADGSMRDALSLLDQCIAFHLGKELTYDMTLDVLGAVDTEVFSRLLRFVMDRNVLGCIELLEEIVMQGRELVQFVTDFTWYLRNLMLVQTADNLEDVIDMSNTDQKATGAATPPAATATPATPGVVKPSVIPVPPTTPAADENSKEDAAKPSGEAQDTQESSGEAPQEERIDSMTAQTSDSQESGTEQITETSGKGTNAGRVAAAAAAGAVVVGGGGAAVYVTMIKGKFKFK